MYNHPTTFQEHLREEMKNPEFRREWERLEPEFTLLEALIELRQKTGLTQRALAKKMGASQAEIARLETGHNVTIKTLHRVAQAAGKRLLIRFV